MKNAIMTVLSVAFLSLPFIGQAVSVTAGESEPFLTETEYSNCGAYVKPATCTSHRECTWVGSCVPR